MLLFWFHKRPCIMFCKKHSVKSFQIRSFFWSVFSRIRTEYISLYSVLMLGNTDQKKNAYIHKESNHPTSILRQIPLSIESCIPKYSSNEKIFKEPTQIYQEALKKSGHNHQLTYQKSINNKNKDNKWRKRKIIWFNPLYSKNVLTKVGNLFLKLINKHFPRHHKCYKLFNKNYVKVSYSCMPNMKNIINTHNKKI